MRTSTFNVTTLIAGLLFIGIGTLFLLDAAGVWDVDPWIIAPVRLIGLGIAFIAGSFNRRTS